ncbi:MAG: hypothetical protein MZV64_41580 [Ignavibacteriales bacterium]|nr:hypothetical protein [Ignavibacteriales bacterium]
MHDDIFFQRYNLSGNKQGENTIANNNTGNTAQSHPSISIDGEGNFVIVWHDWRNGGGYPDIYFQRFNSNGKPQGKNTMVNENVEVSSIGIHLFQWMILKLIL